MLDQGVVSLGSVLFLVCAAQGLAPESLGYFAIALSSVAFTQSLLRAFIGEVLIVGKKLPESAILSSALSASLMGALVASLVFAALGFMIPTLAPAFFGAAFAAPGIVAQDLLRFHYISQRESGSLLATDMLAVVVQAIGIYFAGQLSGSPLLVALVWGCGAGVGALISILRIRPEIGIMHAKTWYIRTWNAGLAYATEAVIGAAVGYAIIISLAVFQAPSETAIFRIAMSVYGFSSLLINFSRSTLVRETRQENLGNGRVWRSYWILWSAMCVSVLSVWVFTLLLPMSVGESLFGESWGAVLAVTTAAMINRLAASWSVVPSVFLRAIGIVWPVVRVRVVVGCLAFGLGPVGAALWGVTGAFLAEAVVYLLLWFCLTVMLTRRGV